MQFDYTYKGSSTVASGAHDTQLSFSPDLTREPTYFSGVLRKPLAFREAISALHDVVVSDLRFKPRDKRAYKEWAATQEQLGWDEIAAQRAGNAEQIKRLSAELSALSRARTERMRGFHAAQRRYFDYLYKQDRDLWFVLDPVITVHPDELFFECFSQDESSYGRLGASYEVFRDIEGLACGTTNIDYSAALYDEFQKIRSYKATRFRVDPSGFDVSTGDEAYREVKIDLPDSWVRGFLQVNSAMTLPARQLSLHPMDVYNLCSALRQKRERSGPRSLRFHLEPDRPVRIGLDPWNTEIVCPRSLYTGDTPDEIRVWGRRRLHVLERLIPLATCFRVYLLGHGMPSFWIADLGDLTFTLGLSGWVANDWSSAASFDLLAPRGDVDELTQHRVYRALKTDWLATPARLAEVTGLSRATVLSALSAWTQAGRAMFDLSQSVYRARALSRDPLPVSALRFASEREAEALARVESGAVALTDSACRDDGTLVLHGAVNDGTKAHTSSLVLDADERVLHAACSCSFYRMNKLHQGPCEHMLALRMQHQRADARSLRSGRA